MWFVSIFNSIYMLCTAMALSVSCDVITQIICLRPFQFTKAADNSVRHNVFTKHFDIEIIPTAMYS